MQTLTRLDQVQTNLIKCKAAISAGQVKNVFDGLCDSTENLHHLFQQFQSESHSQLFKFWNSYINSNGYNIVPTLQRCVELKIVVANRPV